MKKMILLVLSLLGMGRTLDGKLNTIVKRKKVSMQKYHDSAKKIIENLSNGNGDINLLQEKRSDIDDFFEDLFLMHVANDPQELTRLEIFESVGIHEHNGFLNDYSLAGIKRSLQKKKDSLQTLQKYSSEKLSDEQKLSYKIFEWMFTHAIAGEEFILHEYKTNQMWSIIFEFSILFSEFQPLKNRADIDYYLARLKGMSKQIYHSVDLLEHQNKQKIFLPKCAIQKMTNTLKKLIETPKNQHTFYKRFEKDVNSSFELDNKKKYLDQIEHILTAEIYPAYQHMYNYFINQSSQIDTDHGVWALPNGGAFYQYMLKSHTTTDLSADEIHTIGLQEVARIEREMRKILSENGIADPEREIADLIKEFTTGEQFYFPQTDQGREECLAHYYQILDRCRTELHPLFDLKPQAALKIERVPKEYEEGQPAAYYSMPNLTGTRPGTFYANLRNMNELPKFGMETLTVHEAEPGHHFQLALQCELDIPTLRKLGEFTAFYEGWALYTEKLAYEEGFYSSPHAQLGNLQDEMLRAARLVVDTGIHHKRWTKEQAVDYMKRATGDHHDAIVTEVERYFVLPGQACSYKIGQLKILELRQKAKDQLGSRFDIRQFHNVILKTAAVPLTILSEVVDQYIQETLSEIEQGSFILKEKIS